MKDLRIELAVFCCGAVVMALELMGSRLLAPHLGTSLVVWSALIGVVLSALSLGYWAGGRWADSRPRIGLLALVLLLAGIAVAITWLIHEPLLELLDATRLPLPARAAVAAAVLFGPASLLLGMVTPIATRLVLADVTRGGTTVGRLYALSTVGSIAGTFLTGFVLFAFVGSRQTLIGSALLLVLLSLLLAPRQASGPKIAAIVLLTLGAALSALSENRASNGGRRVIDSLYSRLLVLRAVESGSGRQMRVLQTGPLWFQSAVYLDDPDELALEYTRFFRLMHHFSPAARRVLVIGGGGYCVPRDVLRHNPAAHVDVVELDPAVTDLATRFCLKETTGRLTTFHEDARPFLGRPGAARYDVIIGDAFSSSYTLPFHLTTREATAAMAARLKTGGLLLVNIISALEGPHSRFFRAYYRTLTSVFRTVLVFPVQNPENGWQVQNIVLACLPDAPGELTSPSDAHLDRYLSHRWRRSVVQDLAPLTDDLAPVEWYCLDLAR
jgi:spermidine synthase